MSSFSDTIDSIKTSVQDVQGTVATEVPHSAWLAKIAKGGTELKTIQSTITEQTKAYASTMIPQTSPNTTAMPNLGSGLAAADAASKQIALAQDAAKTATALTDYSTLMTKVYTIIDTKKTQALEVLEAKKNSLPNARRQSQLYADDARTAITSAEIKVEAEANHQKELVNF
jgi:hypothetical protein